MHILCTKFFYETTVHTKHGNLCISKLEVLVASAVQVFIPVIKKTVMKEICIRSIPFIVLKIRSKAACLRLIIISLEPQLKCW